MSENDHTKTYVVTLGILLVVTIIEYLVNFMNTSPLKVFILSVLSFIKAAFIVAVFMHVKYQKDRKVILFFGFAIPLLLIIYLAVMIYFDFGISVLN